jgi:hypothetical protein
MTAVPYTREANLARHSNQSLLDQPVTDSPLHNINQKQTVIIENAFG